MGWSLPTQAGSAVLNTDTRTRKRDRVAHLQGRDSFDGGIRGMLVGAGCWNPLYGTLLLLSFAGM